MQKGKFIVFEGIDGSGKSTQIKRLYQRLNDNVCMTSEPTKSNIGTLLRRYLSGELTAENDVLAMLFASDRLDHFVNQQDGIVKTVSAGTTVLCDRNYFSSFAYQDNPQDDMFIVNINNKARSTLKPDVHIFIDITPEKALERINSNRSSIEIFENLESLSKIYNNYYKYFDLLKNEENIFIVNGNRTEDEIADEIFEYVNKL